MNYTVDSVIWRKAQLQDNGWSYDELFPELYDERPPGSSPFKKPKLRKCSRCGTEFFERETYEPCPRCGDKTEVTKRQGGKTITERKNEANSRYSMYVSNARYVEGKGPNDLTSTIDKIVSNAKKRIWIAVPWFYTKTENEWLKTLLDALCNSAKHGIDLRLFLRPDRDNQNITNQILLAGGKVFSKRSIVRHIHTKMVLSEREVLVTTANLTEFDLFRNLNSGTLSSDSRYLSDAEKDFLRLLEPEVEARFEAKDIPIEQVLPENFVSFFKDRFQQLNPMQQEAMPLVLQHRENLLVGAETGTGKTLLAEIAMLRQLLENPKSKIVYLGPLKALTAEKEEEWQHFAERGFSVYKMTGDEENVDVDKAKNAQILISTIEKWDSLTRKPKTYSFVKDPNLVVLDEIHIIDSEVRGPATEALLTRIKRTSPKARIMGLSATMKNVEELAKWLNAESYSNSTYRAVPLYPFFQAYPDTDIYMDEERTKDKLVLEIVNSLKRNATESEGSGKILIFVGTRGKAERTGLMLASSIEQPDVGYRPTLLSPKLAQIVSKGVAFLHSGLGKADREQVVSLFNNGPIDILVSTTALAWGVNLAARTVIIRDLYLGRETEIDAIYMKQMLGRAGRKGRENVGYAFILVPQSKKIEIEKVFLEGKDIESKLDRKILDHINAEIKLQNVRNIQDIRQWFMTTFWFYQDRGPKQDWDSLLISSLDLLVSNGFVQRRKDTLSSTQLGRLTADWYISVKTAISCIERLKDYSFAAHADAERAELVLLRAVAESAEELQSFVRSLEEREEVRAFKRDHPFLVDLSEENAKVCMILHQALETSGYIPDEEYLLTREAVRILGYLSEVGKLTRNISLTVIAKDLAERLQYRTKRGSGRLLNLIWLSTPNNDYKDRNVRASYSFLDSRHLASVTSLSRMIDELPEVDQRKLPKSLWPNLTRLPVISPVGIDGKHLGQPVRLLLSGSDVVIQGYYRAVFEGSETEGFISDWSGEFIDLTQILKNLCSRFGHHRIPFELFTMNRFGWHCVQLILSIIILPISWRQDVLDEIGAYLRSVGKEFRAFSLISRFLLWIKKRLFPIAYGHSFIEVNEHCKRLAEMLTGNSPDVETKVANVYFFTRRIIQICQDLSEHPRTVSSVLATRKGTVDETAILIVSLLRSLRIDSDLVEVRGGRMRGHYLPFYRDRGKIWLLDLLQEEDMPLQLRGLGASTRAEFNDFQRLFVRGDEEQKETGFIMQWLDHYLAPESYKEKLEPREIFNHTAEDIEALSRHVFTKKVDKDLAATGIVKEYRTTESAEKRRSKYATSLVQVQTPRRPVPAVQVSRQREQDSARLEYDFSGLDDGTLTNFGWRADKGSTQRQYALEKAIDAHGIERIYRTLLFLKANWPSRGVTDLKVKHVEADLDWLQRKFPAVREISLWPTAKFEGRCVRCGRRIVLGDPIKPTDDGWAHLRC